MQARFSLPQKNDPTFFQQMFGDVRFICMGGTPQVKCTHDFYESNFVQKLNIKKNQKMKQKSLSPEDENVCRVHARPAGLPLANRQ